MKIRSVVFLREVANRQTDRQTNKRMVKYNFLAEVMNVNKTLILVKLH